MQTCMCVHHSSVFCVIGASINDVRLSGSFQSDLHRNILWRYTSTSIIVFKCWQGPNLSHPYIIPTEMSYDLITQKILSARESGWMQFVEYFFRVQFAYFYYDKQNISYVSIFHRICFRWKILPNVFERQNDIQIERYE